ncbi:MAG: right-handed parallel beta-helix repeat-containing protein [Proteobacteria bacterium]|nr:right-handed parallel beta-helix repeat-containing protein [Pseudomonadota bacterium]
MKEKNRSKIIGLGIIRILLLLCMVIFSWTPVFAVDYYLDVATGNDSNTGLSSGQAWLTLSHAISEINLLDLTSDSATLYAAPGNYGVPNEPDSASAFMISNSNIAIKGADNTTTIINGSGLSAWTDGLTIQEGMANVTITGVRFYGFSNSGVRINPSVNVKIINCYFESNGYGIFMENYSTIDNSPEIVRNTIDSSFYDGIRMANDSSTADVSPRIADNIISGSASNGISMNAMSSTLSAQILKNNISGSGYAGIYMYGDMGDATPLVKGNRIYTCPTGIYISNYNGTSSPFIKNNLITNPTAAAHDYAISISAPMAGSVNPEILYNTIDGGGTTNVGINIGGSMNMAPVIRYNIVTRFAQYGIQKDINLLTAINADYNNAYGNLINDFENVTISDGANNKSFDPVYEPDFSIPQNSPCVDAIPQSVGNADGVDDDIMATSRPRASTSGGAMDYDMGCYEYPFQEYTFVMPTGTGLATDYRLMAMPMALDNPLAILFEGAFGTYDAEIWRLFAYNAQGAPDIYLEMNDPIFGEMFSDYQGKAFWVISRTASLPQAAHTFAGSLVGNRAPYYMYMDQGWKLISLPWPNNPGNPENILLGNIIVDDGVGTYPLTDPSNSATQNGLWDYTAAGYVQLILPTDAMIPGKGYFFYVESNNVKLWIPPDNAGTYFTVAKANVRKHAKNVNELTPPAPPGSGLRAQGGNGCFIGALFSGL